MKNSLRSQPTHHLYPVPYAIAHGAEISQNRLHRHVRVCGFFLRNSEVEEDHFSGWGGAGERCCWKEEASLALIRLCKKFYCSMFVNIIYL